MSGKFGWIQLVLSALFGVFVSAAFAVEAPRDMRLGSLEKGSNLVLKKPVVIQGTARTFWNFKGQVSEIPQYSRCSIERFSVEGEDLLPEAVVLKPRALVLDKPQFSAEKDGDRTVSFKVLNDVAIKEFSCSFPQVPGKNEGIKEMTIGVVLDLLEKTIQLETGSKESHFRFDAPEVQTVRKPAPAVQPAGFELAI
jgi:hypothetical protein